MSDGLPRSTWALPGDHPVCPWCREPVEAATITIGQLSAALCDQQVEWVSVSSQGKPIGGAIVCDCPSCQRPFALAFMPNLRCIAVRTPTDLKFLGDG